MVKFSDIWCGIFLMYSRIICSWHWIFKEKSFISQEKFFHFGVHLILCYWKVVFMPKDTLLVMMLHHGTIFYIRVMLVWIWMVLTSVGGNHKKKLQLWLWNHLVPFYFMIIYILFVGLTWLSILLASLPSSFPTAFQQVSLAPPINKVYIVPFLPCFL